MSVEHAGGVGPVGQVCGERVCVVLCKEPEGAFGRHLTGQVGVGGDDRLGAQRGELAGLLVGECGSQWGDADVPAVAGEGDCEGVDGSFDQDGGRAVAKEFGDGSVELGTLVEQDGVGGVEVLRSAPVVVGEVGVAAGDEPEDLVVRG